MSDVPLSSGLRSLAENLNESIHWAAGYPMFPLCQVTYPMTTGGTPHVELTEAYGLTRAGRYLPRPTELGRSAEMIELCGRELENREDYRRATAHQGAEKGATAVVKAKAMPMGRATSDPSPFSSWNGPWTREENWVWRRLSKAEKRDWSRRFNAWKAEEWAKEGSTAVPEPSHPPRGEPATGSKGNVELVEVDSEPAEAPGLATAKAEAPLAEVPEGAAVSKAEASLAEGDTAAQPKMQEVSVTPKAPSTPEGLLSSHGERSRRRRRRRRSPSSSSTPSGEGRSRRRRWVPPAPPWFWPGLMPQIVGPLTGAIPKVSPPLDAFAARGLPRPPPAP